MWSTPSRAHELQIRIPPHRRWKSTAGAGSGSLRRGWRGMEGKGKRREREHPDSECGHPHIFLARPCTWLSLVPPGKLAGAELAVGLQTSSDSRSGPVCPAAAAQCGPVLPSVARQSACRHPKGGESDFGSCCPPPPRPAHSPSTPPLPLLGSAVSASSRHSHERCLPRVNPADRALGLSEDCLQSMTTCNSIVAPVDLILRNTPGPKEYSHCFRWCRSYSYIPCVSSPPPGVDRQTHRRFRPSLKSQVDNHYETLVSEFEFALSNRMEVYHSSLLLSQL